MNSVLRRNLSRALTIFPVERKIVPSGLVFWFGGPIHTADEANFLNQ
jgi:hypothetical protein